MLKEVTYIETLVNHRLAGTGEARVHVIAIREPIEKWCGLAGCRKDDATTHNVLDCFYANVEQMAPIFQTLVTTTMFERWSEGVTAAASLLAEHTDDRVLVLYERSVESNRHVFAHMLWNDKRFGTSGTDLEYCVFAHQWRTWQALVGYRMDGFVYIDATPELCAERKRERARTEEDAIPVEYLTRIEEHYERWLCAEARPVRRVRMPEHCPMGTSEQRIQFLTSIADAMIDMLQ